MKKLLKEITKKGSELRLSRGERIVDGLELAQDNIIGKLKQTIGQLEDKIEDKLDLGMRNTTQLKFDSIEDSAAFMEEIQAMKVELRLLRAELKIAKETKEELFSEVKEIVASSRKKVVKVVEEKDKDIEGE